jgi:hypothetical protein
VPTEQSFSAKESQASEDKESELGDDEVVTDQKEVVDDVDEKEVVDDVDEEEVENEELPDLEVVGPSSSRMGSYIVAAYHGEWYLDLVLTRTMKLKVALPSATWSVKEVTTSARGTGQASMMPSMRTSSWRLFCPSL